MSADEELPDEGDIKTGNKNFEDSINEEKEK